jgi:hypothetical protein
MATPAARWLPDGFVHPERVDLECGAHLRPIRATDVEIDYPAVMGSRRRLWDKYGDAWGWPPADMTLEQDRDDLAHHEREIAAHETFNYAVFDADEAHLLGCVYIDPPGDDEDCDVIISWWVVDHRVDTPLEAELDRFVPRWMRTAWPFADPCVRP